MYTAISKHRSYGKTFKIDNNPCKIVSRYLLDTINGNKVQVFSQVYSKKNYFSVT